MSKHDDKEARLRLLEREAVLRHGDSWYDALRLAERQLLDFNPPIIAFRSSTATVH